MGGPGSGRKPEGGGGGGNYSHSKVKTAELNKKYTSSGFRKGSQSISAIKANAKAAQLRVAARYKASLKFKK